MTTSRTDLRRDGKGPVVVAEHRDPDGPAHSSDADPWRSELAEVYRQHAGFVHRTAKHLGVPDSNLDDVVHDVFVIAYRRLADFDVARGSVRAWLCGITRRIVLHHRRAAARHRRRLSVVPTEPRPDAAGPDELVARQRATHFVEVFLERLPGDRRIVFALADIEGMSGVDIARSLGMNINTVYSRLRLARREFEAYLERLQREGGAR